MPPTSEQQSLSTLGEKMDQFGVQKFTRDIFQNRQRTSTQAGILKSQAVFRLATVLRDHGMNFLQDVPPMVFDAGLEAKLVQIPGQRSGISTSYFFMLAGTEDLIKPDRWIMRFLKHCLDTYPKLEEAQLLLSEVCEILQAKHPHLTPRLLDNIIWNYERTKKKKT